MVHRIHEKLFPCESLIQISFFFSYFPVEKKKFFFEISRKMFSPTQTFDSVLYFTYLPSFLFFSFYQGKNEEEKTRILNSILPSYHPSTFSPTALHYEAPKIVEFQM